MQKNLFKQQAARLEQNKKKSNKTKKKMKMFINKNCHMIPRKIYVR